MSALLDMRSVEIRHRAEVVEGQTRDGCDERRRAPEAHAGNGNDGDNENEGQGLGWHDAAPSGVEGGPQDDRRR